MIINIDKNKLFPLWSQDYGGEKFVTSYEQPINVNWYYAVVYGNIRDAKYQENGVGDAEIITMYDDYQEAVEHLTKLHSWKYYISAGWIK
jgi:hypothetical protein